MKGLTLAILSALSVNVLAADVLRIGIEGEYPPFSEVNADNELIGFDVDIAKALCEQMARECELVQTSWDGLIPALKTQKIDAIVASMSATEERRQSVDFTNKYYSSNGKFVLRADKAHAMNQENMAEMLDSMVLGVQRATIHDRFASDQLADVVSDIRRYNTQDEVNLDMIAGRVDITLADQVALITGFLDLDIGEGYDFAEPVFNDPVYYGEGIAIAVRKGDDDLRENINTAIDAIRENGTYKTINKQYFEVDIY